MFIHVGVACGGQFQDIKKHLAYRQVLCVSNGATGDRTPDLMTASDKKSRAGFTCCF
jgi:hypothetical protein